MAATTRQTAQGAGSWVTNDWQEVYRLAFSGLANLTGGTSDAGTMVLDSVTWTRRNTSAAYLDSLNIASGKLVWDLNATSSSTDLETAATGPMLRTLINNLSTLIATASPLLPFRWACAVTDVGDENTEVIGLGILGGASGTGRGCTLETGFIGGAAKTQWSNYSSAKSTCPSPVSGSKTALMLECHGARFTAYYGTATAGGEPPPLGDDGSWTCGLGFAMNQYQASAGQDYILSGSNGQLTLHASNGNTNNNFAPSHTGIALAFCRNFVLF